MNSQPFCARELLPLILQKYFLVPFFGALFLIFSPQMSAARPTDAAQAGPYAITSAEYKFPSMIDSAVLPNVATELWAKAFWPQNISHQGQLPLVLLLHGNHPTCSPLLGPREDFDCTYTTEGICPAGLTPTLNHEGFNYLAEHLSSYGMIVVTVSANRGINCGDGADEDWGLNLARGRLLLRHLEKWNVWNTQGGAPTSLTSDSSTFIGHVDLGRVGLFGHSRGGEGVRAAFNLYNEPASAWPMRIPKLNVRAIFEVGAVDGQSGRALDADNTAWTQLVPLCDGDVSGFEGRFPFERMIVKKRESNPTAKALFAVWGANHNFFNTEWQVSDSISCDNDQTPLFDAKDSKSIAQQSIAKISATSFFLAHLIPENYKELGQTFNTAFQLPSSLSSLSRIDRSFITTFDTHLNFRLDDFDLPTGQSSNRVANEASGISVVHLPANEDSPRADLQWQSAGEDRFFQVNWKAPGEAMDVSGYSTLDFRIADYPSSQLTNFSMSLVDSDDHQSLPISLSDALDSVTLASGRLSLRPILRTIRIPLSLFKNVDLTRIRGFRLIFNQSSIGHIEIANVRLGLLPDLNAPPLSTPLIGPVSGSGNGRTRTAALLKAKVEVDPPKSLRLLEISEVQTKDQRVRLTFESATKFPVSDQLLVLKLGEKKFRLSQRVKGHQHQIRFEVPIHQLQDLPEAAFAEIVLGEHTPKKRWMMKSALSPKLREKLKSFEF